MREPVLKRIWRRISDPPSWVLLLVYATTLTVCALAVIALAVGEGKSGFALGLYVAGVLCVAYSLFLLVRLLKKFKEKMVSVADRYTFTRNFKNDYVFRTIVLGACSLVGNVAYTVFLCVTAMYSRALWYWVLAVYYILLTSMRGGLLVENRKTERRFGGNPTRLQKEKIKSYVYCGTMLLVSTLALSLALVWMVASGGRFPAPSGMVYALAVFAVYRMSMAIANMIKAKRLDDLAVQSVRNINFSTALVSVLTLQTVILDSFSFDVNVGLCNALTGAAVCLAIVGVGVYMLRKGKRIREELSVSAVKGAENASEEAC